jgi:hypothetical protein
MNDMISRADSGSMPSSLTEPELSPDKPAKSRNRVDFPQPLGPMSEMNSPRSA